jgi:hypothetical protein
MERQKLNEFVKEAQKALSSCQKNFKGHMTLEAQMDLARAASWVACAQKLLFTSELSNRYMARLASEDATPPPIPQEALAAMEKGHSNEPAPEPTPPPEEVVEPILAEPASPEETKSTPGVH